MHDGLFAVVLEHWREDPFSGHLFVFFGRAHARVKIPFWDGDGFVVYDKRLEIRAETTKKRAEARARPVRKVRKQGTSSRPSTMGRPPSQKTAIAMASAVVALCSTEARATADLALRCAIFYSCS